MGTCVARTEMYGERHRRLYAAGMVKRLMLGVQDFRRFLRERLVAVEAGEHTVLTRRGKAIAVMVPIAWYRDAAKAMKDPTEY